MKKISNSELGRQAAVSVSIVSDEFAGEPKDHRVSVGKRDKIESLSGKVGSGSTRAAVQCRMNGSPIIALIVEDISNPFFASLAVKIEEKAYSLGYRILYCSTENDSRKGNELIEMLLEPGVDGFLIIPSEGMDEQVARLVDMRIPVVLLDRYFPHVSAPSVMVDNRSAVRNGVRHLFDTGYSQIAFVTVDLAGDHLLERENGYREASRLNGIFNARDLILKLPYRQKKEKYVRQIMAFMEEHPGLDAMFFATNYLGICGLETIERLRLSIPEEMAVICFDDHDIFRILEPGITIVQQPIGAMANMAVDMLTGRIEKGRQAKNALSGDVRVIMETTLLVRGST